MKFIHTHTHTHTQKFEPKIKPMIGNLQDELYQLQSKQSKGAKCLSDKTFFKVLENRICKVKQYLNYILIIINENVLTILRTFLNPQKVTL